MVFICFYKDDPSMWSSFESIEAARNYMQERGGCYTVKEGETFNTDWVQEEAENRIMEISYS